MNKTVYIVMGVSGCGKSTIGQLLANELEIPFYDGDDFHPEANVSKMKNGIPLNDEDRKGWLETLNQLAIAKSKTGAVIACSALKNIYREQLKKDLEKEMTFVYLDGTYDEILNRLQKRKGHYMPTDLLKSQFETLEPPTDALRFSIALNPEELVAEILKTRA